MSIIIMREIDCSTMVPSHPLEGCEFLNFLDTKKGHAEKPPKIKRVGRFYTKENLDGQIPRKFLRRTRRDAKKFFSGIVHIGSQKQLVAMFGVPASTESYSSKLPA